MEIMFAIPAMSTVESSYQSTKQRLKIQPNSVITRSFPRVLISIQCLLQIN